MGEVAVYTAIIGGYDDLHPQPRCPGVDYVCFTDDPSMRSHQWRVELATPRYDTPRMAATWLRTHPHVVLPEHRYTIWIDGNIVLKEESFAERVVGCLRRSGIAMLRHQRGPDLVKEVKLSMSMRKWKDEPVKEQLDHYRREGLPVDYGLWASGLIVRDNSDERIRRLNEMWMEENVRWSAQNQISLPYVCWRLGIKPDPVRVTGKLKDNDLFRLELHRVGRGPEDAA